MRSELVFKARTHVPNPFQLCRLTSKASRGLHGGAFVSTAQAINEAFEILARKQSLVKPTSVAGDVTDFAA
jgi:hypothetical protein